jgi:hypothetical protein
VTLEEMISLDSDVFQGVRVAINGYIGRAVKFGPVSWTPLARRKLLVGGQNMSLAGKIETTANASTIVVAVLICAVLFRTYVLAKPNLRQPNIVSASEIVQGKKVDGRLVGVDWAKNHRTLVLVISTYCHFCKDSVPFYHTLTNAGADVKIVAVLPQSVAEGQQYLSSGGVHVDDVRQVALTSLGVTGTPTLMLVNDAGVVTDMWVGKLQPDQETKVLAALEKKTI